MLIESELRLHCVLSLPIVTMNKEYNFFFKMKLIGIRNRSDSLLMYQSLCHKSESLLLWLGEGEIGCVHRHSILLNLILISNS